MTLELSSPTERYRTGASHCRLFLLVPEAIVVAPTSSTQPVWSAFRPLVLALLGEAWFASPSEPWSIEKKSQERESQRCEKPSERIMFGQFFGDIWNHHSESEDRNTKVISSTHPIVNHWPTLKPLCRTSKVTFSSCLSTFRCLKGLRRAQWANLMYLGEATYTFSPPPSVPKISKKMWEKERQVNDGYGRRYPFLEGIPGDPPDFSPDISVDRPFLSVGIRFPPKKLTANFIADFTGSWAEVSVVSWLHVDPVRSDGVMGHFYPFFG